MKIICMALQPLIMRNKTNYTLWPVFRLFGMVYCCHNREIPQNRRILRDLGLKLWRSTHQNDLFALGLSVTIEFTEIYPVAGCLALLVPSIPLDFVPS
jgi:hypothetical protein